MWNQSDQPIAEATRHRGEGHEATEPGSRASGSATTARMGAVPGRRDHGPRGLLPEPSGAAAAGLDAEAGAALRAELVGRGGDPGRRSESTRLNSSHITISYAVFCLKKKKI